MKKESAYIALGCGAIMMITSLPSLLFGLDGFFRDVVIPAWIYWPYFFLGIIIFGLGLWGLLRKESKQEIEREAAKAKAKMDQMYFNEYGVWPDYKEEPEALPENEAKSDQASAGPEADNTNLKSTSPVDTKSPVD